MDIHLFIGEPFHAVCKGIPTIDASQCRQLIAHERPRAAALRQSWIIVGFAIMDQRADARTLQERVIKIPSKIVTAELLKQLRVRPLHTAAGEKSFSVFPTAAEPFEQKNCVRKLISHTGDDVAPNRHGHFVTRIASKTIDTPSAPCEEGISKVLPQSSMMGLQLNKISPNHAPGPRAGKIVILIAQKPLRMVLLQRTTPTGMINYQVEEKPPATRVNRIC